MIVLCAGSELLQPRYLAKMQDFISAMLGEPGLGLIFLSFLLLPLLDARPVPFVMMCVALCKEGCPRLSRNLMFKDLRH